MATDNTKSIISASVRTLAQLVPIGGGAFAQAWSEYDGMKRDARINEFFEELRKRIEALEKSATNLKTHIEQMPDFGKLLEDTVDAVRRETDDRKRKRYPRFLLSLVNDSQVTTVEERAFLLESLDFLSENDLTILAKIAGGLARGDMLSGTTSMQWAPVGTKAPHDAFYEEKLGALMVATSKLEARGLMIQVRNMGQFASSGQGDWYDSYRERCWKVMPLGRRLLSSAQIVT